MAKHNVNFNKTPTLPEGVYTVSVDKVIEFTSEKSGNDGLKWTFTVVEGEHAGRKIFMNTMFTDASEYMLVNLLGALGAEPDDHNNIETETDETTGLLIYPDVIGKICHLKCAPGEYNGTPQTQVKGVVTNRGALEEVNSDTPSLF